MASRFSDINRGPQLAAEYDALQTWRKLSADAKKAAYNGVKKTSARVKPERATAYITPFSALRADIYYISSVPTATQTGTGDSCATILRALINGRYATTAPTGATDTVIKIPKFRFAHVRASTTVGTPITTAKSRFTQRPYTRISTESMTANFGQNTTDKDYFAAVKAMRALAAFNTFNDAAGNSISFRPEIA